VAERVRHVPLPNNVFVEKWGDGFPVLRMKGDGAEEIFPYQSINTRESIAEKLQAIPFRAEDGTLFLGFGLGYHVEEIARRMEADHQIFAVEPCAGILKLAMSCRDLREIFSDDRVHLFAGESLQGLHEMLEYHLMRIVAGHLNEMTLQPLRAAFPQIYAEAENRIQKSLLHLKLSYRHCLDSRVLLKNVLNNARGFSIALDVKNLFGLMKGKPAIVVSGGPSLNRNIFLLKEAAGKACVIAVDTALQPLLAQGTKPNFVVSVDPAEQNYRKIEQLPENIDVSLVYEPGAYFEIPKHFRGYKFVAGSLNSLSKWLLGLVGFDNSLGGATSAAHLAFFLARAMEADPIILVGLDLSFPDERHHVDGAAFTWAPRHDQEYAMVPDIFGGEVKSIPGFQAMIGLFEAEIAKTRARCIDATEGGALIRGTEIMSLASALKKYVSQSPMALNKILETTWKRPSFESKKKLSNGLTWLLNEAEAIAELGEQAIPTIKRAVEKVADGSFMDEEFSALARKIQGFDLRLSARKLFKEIMIDYQAELLIYQYLQGYKIKRAGDIKLSLKLNLESIQQSFLNFHSLAKTLTSVMESVSGQ
jgi:hypothetical protein